MSAKDTDRRKMTDEVSNTVDAFVETMIKEGRGPSSVRKDIKTVVANGKVTLGRRGSGPQ
jgi:hypothetical protein